MNKRIAKKLKQRFWIRSWRMFREQIDKPYQQYLKSLKRPMTEEGRYWEEFWEDLGV